LESDDEFQIDNDDNDQVDTISKSTNENVYVPLKERRRQKVSFLFQIFDQYFVFDMLRVIRPHPMVHMFSK
jgi:hypothetical protein